MSSHSHAPRRLQPSTSAGRSAARRFPYYAVLLYAGLVIALVVADALARASGIDPRRLVVAFLVTMPVCLAGARLLEVAIQWKYFRSRPREIWRVRAGGAAMYGGLPPALVASIPLASWLGISVGTFWDVALVAILAGMVPTRLGCLGAGCCAGRESEHPLALHLRNARGRRARRLPVQLFEALLGAACFGAGLALWGRMPFAGSLALLLCAGYAAGRFALDGLRERSAPSLAGIGAYRWMSAAIVLVCAAGLAWRWTRSGAALEWNEELAAGRAGTLHLVACALLLIPIVRLFRFVGCDLIFTLDDPGPNFPLRLLLAIPELGTGPVTVTMAFRFEPGMTEPASSPFTLQPAGTDSDGRLLFETTAQLTQGDYNVVCTASQADTIDRSGTCSGTLDAGGLAVAFQATANTGPTVLQPRLCFETF